MFENIPVEMRTYTQWVVWRFEDQESGKPTKVPYSALNHRLASSTDASTWCTFDQAVHAATTTQMYSGIGFVLTEQDPFAFIDLDDPYELAPNGDYKHKDPQEIQQRQINIYKEFDSYSELSPSGKGLHIIVNGAIPSGRRRSSIEVYSTERYMTMTGNVYNPAPIRDRNELINALWSQMGQGKSAAMFYAGLEDAKYSDDKIMEMARSAANAEKFVDLYDIGNWQQYYPSQSEADFALVDILAFYSENAKQVKELFLKSALGQREKSRADYRIKYMLNKCFDRMLPPVDVDMLRNQLEAAMAKRERDAQPTGPKQAMVPTEQPQEIKTAPNSVYSVPPGLVGEVAQYIYAQAPRPVAEIALAGAIGLIGGIIGRAYNISGTGLNQYVLLLAPTGTGKEAMSGGIDKLMAAVLKTVPASNDFMGPGEIASPQALLKYMSKTANSFVSVVGEFGIYLQQMANVNAAPHMVGLRRMLLDLYNKSGQGNVLKPSIYSNRDNNTAAVLAPALTILGESTPEKFYEGLHEGMIAEGLLPRFTIIEYHGIRTALNPHRGTAQPSFQLIERLSTLCANALMMNSKDQAINVGTSPEAKKIFDQFDLHCDANINGTDREVRRHLWNRAHIKALKLAAVVAVGCNPYEPVIDVETANWAINMIVADVRNLLKKFDAGEVGIDNDETKQIAKCIACIHEYLVAPFSEVVKYTGEGLSKLHSERIVPYAYLQRRLASVAVFRKDKQGSSTAIKRTLKTLAERGDLRELGKPELAKNYNTTSMAFMVNNPAVFGF